MEANELRIGNWVEVDFGASGKDIQQMDIATFEYCFNGGEGICKPIPLTEEWLLRFGFELEKTGTMSVEWPIKAIIKETYWGQVHPNVNIKQVGECFFIRLDVVNNQIHYVHQLQNLYLALTGNELTLNK